MKFAYDPPEYALFRSVFLEHYANDAMRYDFDHLERVYHVWIGLDYLNYYAGQPQFAAAYEAALKDFHETAAALTD